MNCCDNCNQGRKPCPCPDACQLAEEESFTTVAKLVYTVAVALSVAVVVGSILLQVSLL